MPVFYSLVVLTSFIDTKAFLLTVLVFTGLSCEPATEWVGCLQIMIKGVWL